MPKYYYEKERLAPLITHILYDGEYSNMMNSEGVKGIVTFRHKNKDAINLDD